MKVPVLALIVVLVCASPVWSQLPPDQMVVSSGQLGGGEPGQRNGTFLVAQVNAPPIQIDGRLLLALKFDPYDGTVIMASGATIVRAVLQGANITSSTTLGVLSSESPASMRFDEDGNLLVLAGYWTGSNWESHLHRVLRAGGASLLQILPFVSGAMDIDEQSGAAYFVRNPGANVYRVDPPYTAPPVLVRAFTAPAYGLAFLPAGPGGQLLIPTTWPSFLVLDLASNVMTQLSSLLPPFETLYYLQYHARSRTVWGVRQANGPDSIYACAPTSQRVDVSQVTNLGLLGSPFAMTMNGVPPGSLYIAPMNVPQAGFQFEAGVWGRPGELGFLVMTQPFIQLIATGVCDAAGVLPVKFPVPAGAVQPGTPGLLQFQGATVDPQTRQLTLSAPRAWPRN